MSEKILAWHFLRDDGYTGAAHKKPVAGKTMRHRGKVSLCESGFHASERAIDALRYAPGALIQRVLCGGEIVRGYDKLVCSTRKSLWIADATTVLHEFACDEAERALNLAGNPDPRSVEAITIKRKWLRGEATDDELAAARGEAWDATGDESWAAGAEAWAAAWAAEAEALAAARGEAWAAAWAEAGVATGDEQNARLHAALMTLAPEGYSEVTR